MNKIDEQLKIIEKSKKIGLMTHVVIGYPTLAETEMLVKTMAQSGVDFIELQIPFSDPLADGPTIMRACEQSLAQGTKVHHAFELMRKLNVQVKIPLLFMAYYNTVFRYGVEKFCKDASLAGASGLIIPDMPIDEEGEEHFYQYCKKYNLHAIHVVSPASTVKRLQLNAKHASGFVYCTARQGTTGAKDDINKTLHAYLQQVGKEIALPLAVGFGISRPEHLKALESKASIAVIGSAIVDLVTKYPQANRQQAVTKFLHDLRVE